MDPEPNNFASQSPALPSDTRRNYWYLFNESKTVLIFIHGIFSNCKECWTYENPDDASDRVFWPDLIAEDLRLDAPSIFLAGYATSLSSGDLKIKDAARDIFDGLRLRDDQGRSAPLAKQNLIFIGHSTGGIIARYMLQRFKEEFVDKTVGIILLASPSLGSIYANRLSLLARFYNQQLGLQLRWGGEALDDLDDRFKEMVYEQQIPRMLGKEGYEHYFILRQMFPRWTQSLLPNWRKVVSKESAGRYFGPPQLLSETDHFSAVKPNDVNHSSHRLLVNFWEDFKSKFKLSQEPARLESSHARIPLLFRDQLHHDPASVNNAAFQYFNRKFEIEIRWPKEGVELVALLEKLLTDAEQFYETTSAFWREPPESIAAFTRIARGSIRRAKAIYEYAIHRIVPILDGMRDYYLDWTPSDDISVRHVPAETPPSIVTALGNFLDLANFEAQYGVAYALSHQRTRNLYPVSFWEPWLACSDNLDRMRRLFKIDSQLAKARVLSLCGHSVNEDFWGELNRIRIAGMARRSLTGDLPDHIPGDPMETEAVDNIWFVSHLIPQWNLLQTIENSQETITYRPDGRVVDIRDSSGNEVDFA